jgi:methyl-accepting chemotaxis protein
MSFWKKKKKRPEKDEKLSPQTIFSKNFLFKRKFDKWLKENRELVLNMLVHELSGRSSNSIYEDFFNFSVQLRQTVSGIGDRLAIDMLKFPMMLSNVSEFEDKFISTIRLQGENIKELGNSARDLQSTIQHINSYVEKVANLSQSTQDQALKMANSTEKAREAIRSSLDSTGEITDRNRDLQLEIVKLREVISQVQEQVALISKISDQTNMLALNASIEAARAGDLGRGFSVVAEGVSRLADQSRDALSNINEVIGQMNNTFKSWEDTSHQQIDRMNTVINFLQTIGNMITETDNVSKETLSHMQDARSVFDSMNTEIKALEDKTGFVSRTALGISMKTENLSVWSTKIKEDISDIVGVINESTNVISSNNPIWLLDFLRFRRQDHINWVHKAHEAIQNRDPDGFPEMNPKKCKLGLWYHQVQLEDEQQKAIHAELDEPHRLLHESAGSIREALMENSEEKLQAGITHLEAQYNRIAEILDRYEAYLEQKVMSS